jgi:hypothetical protein
MPQDGPCAGRNDSTKIPPTTLLGWVRRLCIPLSDSVLIIIPDFLAEGARHIRGSGTQPVGKLVAFKTCPNEQSFVLSSSPKVEQSDQENLTGGVEGTAVGLDLELERREQKICEVFMIEAGSANS